MNKIFVVKEQLLNPNDMEPWWLYIMKTGPYLKVGIAVDVQLRRRNLQAGTPFTLSVIYKKRLPRVFAQRFEKHIHRQLRQFLHRGEWFATDVATVRATIKDANAHLRNWGAEYRRHTQWLEPYEQ